ncbi:hypothetical protein GQ55_1G294800 [Panicum hallii var. hallii]|uniref:Secreted protein n=1 Tax=Panicum hallii var. hallii TaxID=1504633 RepID=A0A2T7F8V8_9POAL|nr:hypothetical protein GQ55_1G294800 [Panicum hallii var. hallii]
MPVTLPPLLLLCIGRVCSIARRLQTCSKLVGQALCCCDGTISFKSGRALHPHISHSFAIARAERNSRGDDLDSWVGVRSYRFGL